MISKEIFCKVLNHLKDLYNYTNKLDNMLEETHKLFKTDYLQLYGIFHISDDILLELLSKSMNLDDTNEDILYEFCYGNDFGRRDEFVVQENNKTYVLDSIEGLYDYLIK